jgi:hypothetical protein
MIRAAKDFLFFCFVLWAFARCSSPYSVSGVIPEAMDKYHGQQYGRTMFSRPVPTPPSNVGFLYRQPNGWTNDNPRSFKIWNQAENLYARCWLDGREVLPTAWGQMPQAPIETASGMKMALVIPPGSDTYFIAGIGRHYLKCQLYAGPAPLQLAYEMYLSFQTNTEGGRTFHLRPDFSPMRPVQQPPVN